ncbi:hypothetical protein BBAD15_g2149 [Beauveria bassiana D1-5]|uniref:Zn(2)-C6 fungal-type domain-containing protein n=1 Tax=Beauveria bassiana D1-5 TaxID=1245745 RepID=A0A0A2VWU1_BEABA|nr:hypothetical protein BBAD15_g2149 [Beauveria bassiana D1-5]
MYKPAPPRPKKTNITRTRTGCLECRTRRCDEKKPMCGRCERLGGDCKHETAFKFYQVYKHEVAEKRTVNHPTVRQVTGSETHPLASSTTSEQLPLVGQAGQIETWPRAPEIPQSVILRAKPAEAVMFYSTEWDWQCLASLASVVRKGDMLSIRSSPLFVDIMAAVSASHLSRTSPQRRLLMGPGMREQNFRPNPGHESISQAIYGSVMKKMARWSVQDFGAHPILGLAVITVFCLIESSMGSFQAFGLHYDGAISLIKDLAARGIAQRGQACTLLATLVEIRMQMWWRRVYFGTRDFHRNRPKVSLDPVFSHVSGFESRRASILSILCESHRINNAAIIAHWDLHCHAGSGSLLGDDTTGNLQQMIEPFAQKIRYEKDRLDAWDRLFSLSGRVEDTDMLHATAATLKVRPLHMPSHTEAMDYAYFIVSRVLQCSGPLYSLYTQRSEEMRKRYTEVEYYIHLLLRVVAGMDWQDCVRYNMYTIGITSLLLACLLRSHDPRIGLWCENWLQGCLDGNSFEEGNFPLFQTSRIIRLLNGQRSQERDIFGLFQTVEDGGGSGKFGSYQSQALSSLLVYSRCRTTGQLHSHYVSI